MTAKVTAAGTTSASVSLVDDIQIFVDAEPYKGWEHECYIVSAPAWRAAGDSSLSVTAVRYNYPPDDYLIPLEVKDRQGNATSEIPNVSPPEVHSLDSAAASHTYAVILSGGLNKNMNYQRYWNDCSFIFQTLTLTYGIPKSNIYVIMGDGTDPAIESGCLIGAMPHHRWI